MRSKLKDDAKNIANISVANCAQYNEAAKQFVEGDKSEEYDLMAFSEHHLREPAAEIEAIRG
eukprot:1856743-Pyramimonas_sp.AAC.1